MRDSRQAYALRMKRLFLIVVVLLLLLGIGVVVWTIAGLPPVRMVWRYGFSYQPEPTGQVVPFEGVKFVEIGPGCFRLTPRLAAFVPSMQWDPQRPAPSGQEFRQVLGFPVHGRL